MFSGEPQKQVLRISVLSEEPQKHVTADLCVVSTRGRTTSWEAVEMNPDGGLLVWKTRWSLSVDAEGDPGRGVG